ncbi:hypothetical protein HOY82DRAFT_582329 [Tuber indicum]|nr:hypothetical protein HOY82DRAFT_582329 [Tuber indicum]
MSQLAQECKTHLITFRYRTICVELIINKIIIINSQITKARGYLSNSHNSFIGISEAIRLILVFVKLNLVNLTQISKNHIFNELFILEYNLYTSSVLIESDISNDNDNNISHQNNKSTGLIDGDGYFLLTKKGYNSCEITMDARDKKALYLIKHKYGGTIKQISNANAFKYKLRYKAGLISLINDINGLIRNPTRLLQMNKLCAKFNIELKYPVYYSEASGQVFIGISQKNRYLLEPLISIYGGRVDITSPKIEAFKYVVYRKAELFNLIDNYFSKYPLRTEKMKRINLIKQLYLLRVNSKNKDINKFNE